MASVFTICLILLVICEGTFSQSHATSTYLITAGNSTGSLTDYLRNVNQAFPSFTTLVFSPGVHDMCEDSVVVIKDVTNIALMGCEATSTRSVQVGNGEVVNITEPSTVIDCHGCPSGFIFTNVSEVSVKRIALVQCGAHFIINHTGVVPLSSTTSSLTILAVWNLTLDTVLFINNTGNYSLVAINTLGHSTIMNTLVLQKVSPFPAFKQGNIFLSFTDSLHLLKPMKEKSVLNVMSMVFVYTANDASFHNGWPYLLVDIASCSLDIQLSFNSISIHTDFHSNVSHDMVIDNKAVIELYVCNNASKYQIDVQRIRLSITQQNMIIGRALLLLYDECLVMLDCPVPSTRPIGMTTLTDFKMTEIYWVDYFASMPNEKRPHEVIFDNCQLPYFDIYGVIEPNVKSVAYSIIIRNTTFKNNYKPNSGKSLIYATGVVHLLIDNCNFLHNSRGSGLRLVDGAVHFRGNITFYNNTAEYGGGILMLGSESVIYLLPQTTLNFTKNTALITGGAIHIETRNMYSNPCFIQPEWINISLPDLKSYTEQQGIQFCFKNNTAGIAGTAIWGGLLERHCFLKPQGTAYLANLFGVFNNEYSLSAISSSPQDICYCNDTIVCTSVPFINSMYGPSFTLYPGQSLEVNIAVAGQLNGLVPGLVQAQLKQTSNKAHFGNLQSTQRINQTKCTVLVYTIYSSMVDTKVQLFLFLAKTTGHESELLNYDENYRNKVTTEPVSITSSVALKDCPVGFQHNVSLGSCTCLQPLLHYIDNTSCDINTQTVQRTPTLWISASFTGKSTQTLAVHQHCPFDYCDPNKQRVDLSYPDQQCAHSRSGILCGGCHRGLSLTLGSPKCKPCSNKFLSLLVVFPAAGVALVAILTCLNLTVSVGTINGLILYVNIIQAIHPVFFPSTNFLSVFVAWMNLDIGIESCLYDGMDFYGLTWLQFLFPVYIWLLVSIMIITSHYSTTAAKLVGRHAVKVLATLFLLSYAKLLRTIITVLSFTYISYEDSKGTTYRTAVWLYDGNVDFIKGKHIPLFLVAVGFGLIYILPFTLLLLLAPCLQARSHRYKALRWVSKLMPFLDAYQGPFNKRFRFWSGLLLLARIVLLVGFALNSFGDPQIHLMLIVTLLLSLLSLQWLLGITFQSGIPYNKPFINYLEAFYLCNLGILSTWSLLQVDSNTSSKTAQLIITNVCVGLAFLVCVCILAYHAYLWLAGLECGKNLWQKVQAKDHPAVAVEIPDLRIPQEATLQNTSLPYRESLLNDH